MIPRIQRISNGFASPMVRIGNHSRLIRARSESEKPAEPAKGPEPVEDVAPIDSASAVEQGTSTATAVAQETETPIVEVKEVVAASKADYTVTNAGTPLAIAEGQLGSILSASPGLLLRGGTGAFVIGYKGELVESVEEGKYGLKLGPRYLKEESSILPTLARPENPLVLYEFEACPFCKKVREMVSYLDLDVLFYPCPSNGPTFRPEAIKKGGKSQFPYLEDPNTGSAMYESDDIIQYLSTTYGDGSIPPGLSLGVASTITAGLSSLPRIGKGARYSPSKIPEEPLVLWGYENSPFVKVVKERLTELELPHLLKSSARGSAKRQVMFDKYGKFQVPLLEDPNTMSAVFDSDKIVQYLTETYSTEAEASA